MQTQDIRSEEWIGFFEQFSRDHAGWLTTIQVLDPEAGPENVAAGLPLQGISFDTKGSRRNSIAVSVGGTDNYLRHVVDLPLRIREATGDDGSIDLQLEPATGPQTLIHLHTPRSHA